MAVIAEAIMLGNSLQYAPRLVAAGVFELAAEGYIKLEKTPDGVIITRTTKPTNSTMPLEQRLLLEAVTASENEKKRVLHAPQQVPVAQTVAVLTTLLLRERGLARASIPRRVMRRLGVVAFVIYAIPAVLSFAAFPPETAVCVAPALIVMGTLGWNSISGVKALKRRAVFYTKQGRRKLKQIRAKCGQLIAGNGEYDPALLSYELLWTTNTVLQHAPDAAPHWFKDEWPKNAEERAALLRNMFATIARALNQPTDKKGRFELNEAMLEEIRLYEALQNFGDAGKILYAIAADTHVDPAVDLTTDS